LNVVLFTGDTEKTDTFGLRGITATLSSTLTTTLVPLPDDLVDPICSVHDDELHMADDYLIGSCRESSSWWDQIVITPSGKRENVTVLLLGKRRRLSLSFRRIPIDSASPLDGDWNGTSDLGLRHSLLHFRGGVMTFDVWGSGQGCWGRMSGGLRLNEDNVMFSNTPSIKHSMFVGKLSPDKQEITCQHSCGDFAGRKFFRLKQ